MKDRAIILMFSYDKAGFDFGRIFTVFLFKTCLECLKTTPE